MRLLLLCFTTMVLIVLIEVPQSPLPLWNSRNIPPALAENREQPLIVNIDRGKEDMMEVSLTFDGGSGKKFVRDILKTIREKQVKVTIFLTGEFIVRYPELVLEMVEDDHEIGNHTFTHPHLTNYRYTWRHETLPGIDKAFLQEELLKTARAFKELTGMDMTPFWRVPFGEINREILRWGFEAGYTHVSWTRDKRRKESLDSLDWVSDKGSKFYLTSEDIKNRVLSFGKGKNGLNGGIILMHLSSARKEDQAYLKLGELIDSLREDGYRFVLVSKLIKGLKIQVGTQVASKRSL